MFVLIMTVNLFVVTNAAVWCRKMHEMDIFKIHPYFPESISDSNITDSNTADSNITDSNTADTSGYVFVQFDIDDIHQNKVPLPMEMVKPEYHSLSEKLTN